MTYGCSSGNEFDHLARVNGPLAAASPTCTDAQRVPSRPRRRLARLAEHREVEGDIADGLKMKGLRAIG